MSAESVKSSGKFPKRRRDRGKCPALLEEEPNTKKKIVPDEKKKVVESEAVPDDKKKKVAPEVVPDKKMEKIVPPIGECKDDVDEKEIEKSDDEETDELDDNSPKCLKCKKKFSSSWLFDNFQYKCCYECSDEQNQKLITKTRALSEYLLKDFHLEKEENPLMYIEARNPHKRSWAPMKLYLRVQVEELAMDVWGSKEKLEQERKNREQKKIARKAAKNIVVTDSDSS